MPVLFLSAEPSGHLQGGIGAPEGPLLPLRCCPGCFELCRSIN